MYIPNVGENISTVTVYSCTDTVTHTHTHTLGTEESRFGRMAILVKLRSFQQLDNHRWIGDWS